MVRRLLILLLILLAGNAGMVLALRWIPPPASMLMLTAPLKPVHYEWIPWRAMSPNMALAVIASEDEKFPDHHGFDFAAIDRAMAYNAHHRHGLHGGSTISQQTAKNLFLWRGRTYLRKALEAYFTVQLEALWDKRRVLEVYLNIVQFGPDIYGVEAAAQHYFHKHAGQLTMREAAALAAVLPDPRAWRPDPASARAGMIVGRMRRIGLQAVARLR